MPGSGVGGDFVPFIFQLKEKVAEAKNPCNIFPMKSLFFAAIASSALLSGCASHYKATASDLPYKSNARCADHAMCEHFKNCDVNPVCQAANSPAVYR